jgi:hypothetical protein
MKRPSHRSARAVSARCLEWPLNASGGVHRSEAQDFVAGIRIARYYSSGDPLIRYDRRRFQLVTPSRVASGGVFIERDPEDRLNLSS